jgi:hypothetical protein
VDLAACDVSFISVTLILPPLAAVLREQGEMVILVKPQFEVGRGQVGKGGIVRDPALHEAAVLAWEAVGTGLSHRMESPSGAEGNRVLLSPVVETVGLVSKPTPPGDGRARVSDWLSAGLRCGWTSHGAYAARAGGLPGPGAGGCQLSLSWAATHSVGHRAVGGRGILSPVIRGLGF